MISKALNKDNYDKIIDHLKLAKARQLKATAKKQVVDN